MTTDEAQAALLAATNANERKYAINALIAAVRAEGLHVERLAKAIWLVQHNTAAEYYDRNVPPGSPHRAEVDELGEQVAAEYAALPPERGEP